MFQPFISFHYKHSCPKCNTTNWTYHSHSLRSYPDTPEICKCHSCHERYWLMSEEEVNDIYREEDFEMNEGETLMDVCGVIEDEGTPEP